jgi:acetoin utilization protein AcuB
MTRDTATIEVSESAHAAIGKMLARKIRHLPVLDASGALVGIVTDRDLRHYLFTPGVFGRIGKDPVDTLLKSATVKQLMSSPAVSVDAGEDLEAAARLMIERKIGSLPVVDGRRVVGIVTETDLLRQVVSFDARTAECEAIIVSFP